MRRRSLSRFACVSRSTRGKPAGVGVAEGRAGETRPTCACAGAPTGGGGGAFIWMLSALQALGLSGTLVNCLPPFASVHSYMTLPAAYAGSAHEAATTRRALR